MELNSLHRSEFKNELKHTTFDVLVIGGGITGAGIALDAASRGMKVALVEMQDFAAGTSSRSTKLVHGGLRYLKQLQVGVVAEVGKERAIVYENGPHVTTPEWMLLPFHEGGTFGKFSTSMGLRVYDFLAGVKKKERRKMLTVQETLERAPLVKKDGLKGGGYYVEYRTDDARLTIEVMKEAAAQGAVVMNYMKADQLVYHNGKITGIIGKDLIDGEEITIHSRKVINASGPWVDTIREMDHSKKGKVLQLTKGVHIVIDQSKFPLQQAVYFDTPDGRMVFAIPRDGKAYVGTTDTFYDTDPKSPQMTDQDRDYILDAINYMFPTVSVTKEDVESSWAGVRPLISQEGKGASEISRKDETWISDSGLITIAGGKLTGYRKMAETVVNLVAKQFRDEGYKLYSSCSTDKMPISGGHVGGSSQFEKYIAKHADKGLQAGLSKEEAVAMLRKYGSNAPVMFELAKAYKEEAKLSGLPLDLFVALRYSIEQEMVVTPLDFFNRRTGKLLFDIASVYKWKDAVIEEMAKVLHWSDKEKASYTKELEEEMKKATIPMPAEMNK
ncbi:glycerol-3-phosphate dehydrogenase [Bacillus sp. FJAT-27916]|uniref:glycerol-3-phosphate dehydrogenase/oxidase n=1 Tax=Bacillaceae TaxID=186817 RepID=UPI0006708662|nr:glycerol-3-phosphate dehydrogenase/oxidase [Bacillus sp. FJAT-27916]KMY45212.1 glycerol-3-phosphate dehydrogenase [Bacillus sp. FJAT-27916]